MMRRLILWDIDGTLVSCGPVGREALEVGARRAAGLDHVPHVVMAGKTDPQIVREIFAEAGLREQEIVTLLPVALEEAEQALAAAEDRLRRQGRVHAGVRELLEALAETGQVRQTLVTGNIAVNAPRKIAAFGLDGFFDFEVGAYGSDNPERDCLVPICLRRVSGLRGETYTEDEIWVIGDTSHDLRCARAGGVRCLLVGTGHAGFASVQDLDADAKLPNLADTEFVLETLFEAVVPPARTRPGRQPRLDPVTPG